MKIRKGVKQMSLVRRREHEGKRSCGKMSLLGRVEKTVEKKSETPHTKIRRVGSDHIRVWRLDRSDGTISEGALLNTRLRQCVSR